jgi:hypothetical protein
MAATAEVFVADDSLAAEHRSPGTRGWRREAVLVAVFYLAYAQVRNLKGREAPDPGQLAKAQRDATHVIRVERAFGLFQEQRLQQLVLDHPWIIHAANAFYTTCHFMVTLGVLVWLYRSRPALYRRWRSVLGVATGLALVGFVLFPTLPPRLLASHFGFVDTLARYGGLWSFNSGAIERISDPFAAMPSLHLVWATWCMAAVLAGTRRRRVRIVALAYPLATSLVVIITGNHYILDLVAGAAVFAIAWLVCVHGWPAVRRATAAIDA